MSQNQDLLHALRKGPVGPRMALARLNIYRLAARIFELRGKGHEITTTMVQVKKGTKVAMYTLDR